MSLDRVTNVESGLANIDENGLYRLAASVEQLSEHPLGKALIKIRIAVTMVTKIFKILKKEALPCKKRLIPCFLIWP